MTTNHQPEGNRWLPVLGGMLMNLALGTLYAWSVFVLPLEKEFSWTRAETSWVYTIAIISFALTFIGAGRLQDLKGPKIPAFLGGVLVSVGFFLASLTSSLFTLYVFFGMIVGIGNGFGYATPTPVASKWFPDKRGLVIGLMVGAYGGGQAIFGTMSDAYLIPQFGWRTTFRILAVVFFAMTMIGTLLLRNPPDGYRPKGWTPPAGAAAGQTNFTTAEMLRTPTFYFLWIAYCLGTTAGQMTISQLVPFARSAGLGATIATYSLIVSSLGNAGGRILSGWMSDTLGRLRTLKMMVLLSTVAMPALYLLREQPVFFFILIAAVYWSYGTQLSLFASTTADFYGTRHLGLNYGLLFTAWGAAGTLGPGIAGRVYTSFGDYRYAFFSAAVFTLVSFVALSIAKTPVKESSAPLSDAIPSAPAR